MAGEAELLDHGVELAMAPLLWALQFFQFLGFFLKVSGPDNSDDFSVGRFLIEFLQPVFIEFHFACGGDDIHNRFAGFHLGTEFFDLKFGIGIATG